MKRFKKYGCLISLMCMATLVGQAKTIHVNVNDNKNDLTQSLRETCAKAGYNDTVMLAFAKGVFTVSGTIRFQCHTIIKGQGRDKTVIILDKGNDRTGFKSFPDDTYFRITGTLQHPITAEVSDLTIKLKEHEGIWWDGEARHAIKIYHANRVDIHHVDSYMENAVITNIDMRVCSNVTVSNCIISNYNNCEDGGGLWIRGEMHNILVKGNQFYKYGKDETLGIYDRVVDASNGYTRGKASRTNIIVEDNEFHYGDYKGKMNAKNPEANCGMIFTLMTDHKKSQDPCTTRNFHMRNNKFYINDVTTRCMYIGFDPADVHEDIYIENNKIINSDIGRDYRYYHHDFEIHDLSSCNDPIHIKGNTVTNKNLVLNSHGSTGYSFMQLRGGIVDVEGNSIVNHITNNRQNGKPYGVQLVWCSTEGGTANLRSNTCKGLQCIATIGGGDGTQLFTLCANNNYFEGDTRVYSHKIKQLNINFTGNTFKSNNMNFFLQEFAPKGSVVFNNNDVTVIPGGGQFLTHWSKNSTQDYRFDRLEVKNNTFNGVKNEQNLFKNITNVGKRTMRSNTIKQQ